MCSLNYNYCVILVVVFLFEFSIQKPLNEVDSETMNQISSSSMKGVRKCLMQNSVRKVTNCAAEAVLTIIERASTQPNISIFPGVELISDHPPSTRMARILKDVKFSPRELQKGGDLLEVIVNATGRFISGKSLKIKFPDTDSETMARFMEEGRGKIKKIIGPWILGLGAKLIIIPILFGGLILYTTKAIFIGKVALLTSLILFVRYFLSGRNIEPIGVNYGLSGNTPGQLPYGYGTNSLGGWGTLDRYPYARSIDIKNENRRMPTANPGVVYSTRK